MRDNDFTLYWKLVPEGQVDRDIMLANMNQSMRKVLEELNFDTIESLYLSIHTWHHKIDKYIECIHYQVKQENYE